MQQQYGCINLTESAHAEQLFKIKGHSAMQEKRSCIASRIWTVGGYDWKIEYYYYDTWIRFRVRLLSRASEVAASFNCNLVDPELNLNQKAYVEKSRSHLFNWESSIEVSLVSRSALDASRCVKDDYFLVRCAITVVLSAGEPTKSTAARNVAPAFVVPSSDLHTHFGELLRSQKGVDVTFLVSGQPVGAHRCVLAARSPVFMAELYGGMMENDSQHVEIRDIELEVFKAMLYFIYTDTLPELDQLEKEQATKMAQHLLAAADRYGLERLKAICEEKVSSGISVDTVATTLALAEQHGCSKLKARCMEFVVSSPANLDAITATEGYNHLMASCPSVFTDLLKLTVGRHK